MNTNLFHNIVNVVSAIAALITMLLIATGCTQEAITGALECSNSFINPAWTAATIMVLMVIKTAVNIVRDGIKGLALPQPPVQKPTSKAPHQ